MWHGLGLPASPNELPGLFFLFLPCALPVLVSVGQTIESSQEIITLNLDATRNRIIRLNLYIAMGTLGFSFSATVAGIFGMNLVSGLEEHPTAFYNTVPCHCLGGRWSSI